jgi:glycosyltransferase involved in cell wall biosynthesis
MCMNVLQIGLEWFPEHGGGLDKLYYDYIHQLPNVDIQLNGLVVGSSQVESNSNGIVKAFAPKDSSLWKRWLGVYRSVQRLMRQSDYDLVAVHFALYAFPLMVQLQRQPIVFHFHGPWALESQIEGDARLAVQAKKRVESFAYHRGNSFIVLSTAFRNLLHREYQVPLEKIYIIPPGVDNTFFNIPFSHAKARKQLNWPQDNFIFLTVRRLVRRMGLENLIEAVDLVRKEYPNVLLLIAGKGSLAETLQKKINTMGLGNHIKLLGYVSDYDLKLAYRAADISVVPTLNLEGFGLIVIESLAAGTPVLGTPVDAIPETLSPLSEDLVFAGSTPEHMAKGMIEVLAGQRKLPSSNECVSYARNNYSWPVIAPRIKDVYSKSIAQHSQ